MSETKIKVGKTIDEAMSFTTSNMGAIVRVGWLPLSLMLAGLAAVSWVLLRPIIFAYIEFVAQFSDIYEAAAEAGGATSEVPVVDDTILLQAFEQVGAFNLTLGYVLFMLISFVGGSIVMTAYSRMMVTGERYGGLAHLRFGNREMNVALTYFAIMLILIGVYLALVFGGTFGAIVLAGMLGDGASIIIGLLVFVLSSR